MSASRLPAGSVLRRQLQCEILESRMVPDGTTWTVLPEADPAAELLADTHLTVAQNATVGTEEPNTPPAVAAQLSPTPWQGVATFPILVTALLVTLCGQVELFGGRTKRDSWTTPLL